MSEVLDWRLVSINTKMPLTFKDVKGIFYVKENFREVVFQI